ncbi:hypothetical protein [Mesorhizobium sp. B2-1-3]|uniref:hypothetical protein n=1 Tax=Mesorhizobium sp. B2-1-3 TaxID=2589972 RepID=UPI0015E351CF|nr:hypothetical protein [Mesorhizobium sp. B2-1-3]
MDDLKIHIITPVFEGIPWPIEARTTDEAWQIMRRNGFSVVKTMTRAEAKELFQTKPLP